jgi:hypothetical protein
MSFHALRARAGASMTLSTRSLRRSVICLIGMMCVSCAAQQFIGAPDVELTGGRVTSFLTGTIQYPTNGPDILYINAPASISNGTGVVAGVKLNAGNGQFEDRGQNHILFTNATNVVAALADFNNDRINDFAFAISGVTTPNLCIYYGTGFAYSSQSSSYNVGSSSILYPVPGGKSGCMTFTTVGPKTPNFAYIAALPFTTGGTQQLLVEDSANNELYVFINDGNSGSGATLPSITFLYSLPLAGGAGPIYSGDFNGDGKIDFIINGQTNHTATVYLGNGDGTFQTPVTYTFGGHIYSMLLQQMEGDSQPSMVVEGGGGVITIHRGNPDGTFVTASEGGTSANPSPLFGNGGQLAAIGKLGYDPYLDILTTTPIGLSVLVGQGQIGGNLTYTLRGIYNIGPGRSSYALTSFYTNPPFPDFAVDSPEGVAIVQGDGNGDGGFMTSNAYSTLAPALGATEGQFRNMASNPNGCLDVAVATGAVQGQLLTGNASGANCTGTFNTFANPTNTSAGPVGLQAGLWSNLLSGDFNGDGKPDLAYSLLLTEPLPLPSSGGGLYVQSGNGDGTFQAPVAVNPGEPVNNNFYGGSAVGFFNSSGTIADIANIDGNYNDTLLGQSSGGFSLGLNQAAPGNTLFSQVAAGFFKTGRTNQQDLVFQNGTTLVPYVNKQNGTGTIFTAMTPLTGPSGSYAISTVLLTDVTDTNGFGNGDVLALFHNTASTPLSPSSGTPNWLYIWVGNGDGTFKAPQKIQLSRNFYLAAVMDMNGDTLPDIVLSDGYVVGILYNQGGGIFKSDFNTCAAVNGSDCDEEHFLAGQGINSLSLQNVRGGGRPDLVVANGGLTISNPVVLLGNSGAPSLTLAVNPVVNTGGITVLLNKVTSKPTNGTLTASPEPSNFGATFTITEALTSTAGVAPTGFVSFSIDGTLLGSVAPLATGATTSSAIYTVRANNTYAGGTHSLTAVYGGDGSNSTLNLSGSHLISAVTTTTDLFLCIGPTAACPSTGAINPHPPFMANLTMFYGQTWNGTTDVNASDGSAVTGTITLNDQYTGVAPPPPSPLCTLSASLTGAACPASVGTTIGTSVGTNLLTAVYSGDTTHQGSTSPTVTIVVSPDTTTATVAGPSNPTPQGQPVTLTATLTGNYAAPTGPVSFMYGSTVLCAAVNLVAGSTGNSSSATCTTSALPAGTDTITASYAATLDFQAVSATTSVTISALIPPTFAITVTPSPVSAGVGNAAPLTVTVTPLNGFAEGVNLSCGNLPSEASCFFAQAAIAGGGGSSPLLVETSAPHNCNDSAPYFTSGNGGGPGLAPFALPALAGLAAFFLPGRRRWLRALLAAVLLAGATQITGCGNCTDLGTKPGTYTFQVIGTSTGTGQVQSQAVTLTITI